jgi:hypothetical protein
MCGFSCEGSGETCKFALENPFECLLIVLSVKLGHLTYPRTYSYTEHVRVAITLQACLLAAQDWNFGLVAHYPHRRVRCFLSIRRPTPRLNLGIGGNCLS